MSSTGVEPDVATSASFPLPFRVMSLTCLGIFAWATNLYGLYACGIDVVSAMNLRTEGYPPRSLSILPAHRRNGHAQRHVTPPYTTFYSITFVYFIWFTVTYLMFISASHGDPDAANAYSYIPALAILVVLTLLICPFRLLFKRERDKFLHTLSRCMFSRTTSPVYFSDVVFADVFTSFAKVLGDLWLSFCMFLPGNSIASPPVDLGWKRWVLPTVMSLPYLVRFRQCLIEYALPSNESRRPLFNALKYATSFPVIYLSAAQRIVLLDLSKEKGVEVYKQSWHGEHYLFRLWLLSAIVNSLYSFWWDVTYDWGLEILKIQSKNLARPPPPRQLPLPHMNSGTPLLVRRGSQESIESNETRFTPADGSSVARKHGQTLFPGLRSVLLYPTYVYVALIFVNFILRMTWSVKLSSHLHLKTSSNYTILLVEVAEIVRRWMWVFLRVEWEVIKKLQEGNPNAMSENGDDRAYEMALPIQGEHSPTL
ncbi:hypothetical protein AMATHDRAFT_136831 [Amanita thiersii Skay4041]|uniref:EXS domain-containing protein n=1 Tax=Amanita thiersii Skay4041 TaxID=703135 RepID=A0A2A9NS71_9AGAR|nr:hypothetical protein AMATHDRAFT_136831 [Amanita thiersii Skay4041]